MTLNFQMHLNRRSLSALWPVSKLSLKVNSPLQSTRLMQSWRNLPKRKEGTPMTTHFDRKSGKRKVWENQRYVKESWGFYLFLRESKISSQMVWSDTYVTCSLFISTMFFDLRFEYAHDFYKIRLKICLS